MDDCLLTSVNIHLTKRHEFPQALSTFMSTCIANTCSCFRYYREMLNTSVCDIQRGLSQSINSESIEFSILWHQFSNLLKLHSRMLEGDFENQKKSRASSID